ncbi:MAG: MFS transporter, partial [Frankia sp.]
GVRVIPVAAGISLASPIAGRLARRYPARILSSAGMALTAAALITLAVIIDPSRSYPPLGVCLLAVGLGSGLFMTPNTSSIMTSVPADRRGIANGVRSMLQNTGFVVSTALSLAIVTSPLDPVAKQAAYAGTLSALSTSGLDAFTAGYRVAFAVLAGACVIGMVASLARNPPTPRRPAGLALTEPLLPETHRPPGPRPAPVTGPTSPGHAGMTPS